jgi:hypothetical protein
LGLATILYCLILETSLFVASYDSQGHGGGIRLRLHTGIRRVFWLCPLQPLDTDHTENTIYIFDEIWLPSRCLAIDVLLLSAQAWAGMCLRSRYLAKGIHVIFSVMLLFPSLLGPNMYLINRPQTISGCTLSLRWQVRFHISTQKWVYYWRFYYI